MTPEKDLLKSLKNVKYFVICVTCAISLVFLELHQSNLYQWIGKIQIQPSDSICFGQIYQLLSEL